MCGICGFSGKPDENLIKKMTRTLYHRGPDDEGFYVGRNINLGMRRLSIIDLVGGHQPISNEDKKIWIVFNGEIYNFVELKKELEKKGHVFSTKSDTETIVHLYEEYGLDFPNKMNGMFAIGLWDAKKEQLILARDRLGVKPLYYFFRNGKIIFGSEIKAILSHPFYKKEIDFESLHHYFSFKHVPAPKTIYRNIFALLPGELLVFKGGKIQKRRYWSLVFKERDWPEEELGTKIAEILTDAVRLRMRSDVTVGAYLSGGLDSSSIVALMTQFTNKPINTFCLGYEDKFQNKVADFQAARQVSKIFKTNHHEYIMSWREIPETIGQIIGSFDEPFGGVISSYFISQIIKKYVRVALSGDGADEIFASYLSHRLAGPIDEYFKSEKKDLAGLGFSFSLKNSDALILSKIADKEPWKWRSALFYFKEPEKKELYSNYLKEKTKKINSEFVWKQYLKNTTSKDPLNKILEAELKTYLPDQVLAFVDRLSMAHSIELRTPFLDYRLVELTATIPGGMKIKNGAVKYILKKAVKDLLPQEIIDRPKEGFVLPINTWLHKNMQKYVEKTLNSGQLRKHGFFDENVVKTLVKCYYNQTAKNLYEFNELSNKIWLLVIFQLWWKKYFL